MLSLSLKYIVVLAGICLSGSLALAEEDSKNPANNWLLHQTVQGQASMLGKVVGEGCKGKTPFYRGSMEKNVKSPGDTRPEVPVMRGHEYDAFWDIRCTNGKSYSVSVYPNGNGKVAECRLLEAIGDHCFRKFPGQ